MTNVIFLNTFFPFSKAQDKDYETKIFIEVARKAVSMAESQAEFGMETQEAISESGQTNLAPIAVWHFQKAIEHFHEAINNLEQAKMFSASAKYKKYIELKEKKCIEKLEVILRNKGISENLINN